jgi:hypothetical protein
MSTGTSPVAVATGASAMSVCRSLFWLFMLGGLPWFVMLGLGVLWHSLLEEWLRGLTGGPQSWLLALLALFLTFLVVWGYENLFDGVMKRVLGQSQAAQLQPQLPPKDSHSTVSDAERLFDWYKHVIKHLQDRIDGEYTDVASRVGWLMTSQAFLLGAFVAVLSSAQLSDSTKYWFATGVAFAGAVTAFVLAVATMFGHALIENLKRPRDEAEQVAQQTYGLPPAGVPWNSAPHQIGHSATRYLPCFAYVAWVSLTLLAVTSHFDDAQASASSSSGMLMSTDALEQAALTQGWQRYEKPSPPFAAGAVAHELGAKDCAASAALAEWAGAVVSRWRQQRVRTGSPGLVVVVRADPIDLMRAFEKRSESNTALAYRRAESIKSALIKASKIGHQDAVDWISPKQVLILMTVSRQVSSVPRILGLPGAADVSACDDRVAHVWLPATAFSPPTATKPPTAAKGAETRGSQTGTRRVPRRGGQQSRDHVRAARSLSRKRRAAPKFP